MFNRKAIAYEFLLRLVIAIALAFGFFFLVMSFFRLTSEGEDSFNQLAEAIEEVEEGELKAVPLVMDDDTAIIGFSESESDFAYISPNAGFRMKRPSSLACQDSACVCLCRKGLSLGMVDNEDVLSCSELICNEIENSNFPLKYQPGYYSVEDISEDYFFNGFLIIRGGAGVLDWVARVSQQFATGRSPPYISNIKSGERTRSIYIEKEKGFLKVYETPPQ